MIKRLLSVVAKLFAVLLAGGAVVNALGLTSASRQADVVGSTSVLAAALSVALAIALWRLGSWLSPPIAPSTFPAERQLIYQNKMKQAAVWCVLLLAALAGAFLLLIAAPSVGESVAPILPLVLMAAAIALVRFCWYFVKARGRWRTEVPVRTAADAQKGNVA